MLSLCCLIKVAREAEKETKTQSFPLRLLTWRELMAGLISIPAIEMVLAVNAVVNVLVM